MLANKGDLILFDNCEINYGENSLIYYSPFAYTQGTYSNVEFNKCNIDNNDNPLVYAYSKPNGSLSFIDTKFNIPSNITIFDGYPSNIEFINKFSIEFGSSPLPDDVMLIEDKFKDNTNIKIN